MTSPEPNDEEIEKALRRLKPGSLPISLRDRLARLDPSSTTTREPEAATVDWLRLLIRFVIPGMAAAIVAGTLFFPSSSVEQANIPQPQPPSKTIAAAETDIIFTPIETNQVVLAAEELAILPGPDNRPVQLMRVCVLDYERARAEDGSELLVATPREQVIPVTLTAY